MFLYHLLIKWPTADKRLFSLTRSGCQCQEDFKEEHRKFLADRLAHATQDSISSSSPLNRYPIRESGAMSGAITVDDVIPKCREKLAGTKVPASIIFHFRLNVYAGQ